MAEKTYEELKVLLRERLYEARASQRFLIALLRARSATDAQILEALRLLKAQRTA
jgi:hypothetical protein